MIFNHVLYQLSYLGAGPAAKRDAEVRGVIKARLRAVQDGRPAEIFAPSGFQAKRRAEPVLESDAVLFRQHAWRLVGIDDDASEQRLAEHLEAPGEVRKVGLVCDVAGD